MSKKNKNWKPGIPPVERVELSKGNIILRAFLIGVLLLIAGLSFGSAINAFLNVEPGIQEIEVTSDTVNCSTDFIFTYDFSDYGGEATAAYKQIEPLYSKATEDAFRIFSPDYTEDDLRNVAYLNAHVNEVVTVDPALHMAIALLQKYGNRSVYLAPVYVEYERIFAAGSPEEAAIYDPAKNEELLPYIRQLTAFANDPDMIDLELVDDQQVCLRVSDAYLEFAEVNEIETFVDFGWMTNAFICDYLADTMVTSGFVHGNIVSFDGFTRNMDDRGVSYNFNIFDRVEDTIYVPGAWQYTKPESIVSLRSYPISELDIWRFCEYEDGSVASLMIDPADGMSKASISDLLAYSGEAGCAEVLLRIAPSFISDRWNGEAMDILASDGIYAIWCEGQNIRHTESAAKIVLDAKMQYSVE